VVLVGKAPVSVMDLLSVTGMRRAFFHPIVQASVRYTWLPHR
jgi:hypothetical protein